MEHRDINKEKSIYFAHHLSQQVIHNSYQITGNKIQPRLRAVYLDGNIFAGKNTDSKDISNYSVVLTSLEYLETEDAIAVVKIVCTRLARHFKPEEVTYERIPGKAEVIVSTQGTRRYIVQICYDGIAFVDYDLGGAGREHYYCPAQYAATTYLQHRGYALQFMDYSIEQLVAMGWLVLKGS